MKTAALNGSPKEALSRTTNNNLISSNFVQVDGLNIHYLTAGEGKPVILLHGWPTSSYLWRKIIPPLAKVRKVIVPDLPGFGKSDKPLNVTYTHNYQSKVLGNFLDEIGVGKAALVFHDIGAPIALLWAIRNLERVDRLVILNSLFYPDAACKLFYTRKISLLKRYLNTIFYPKGGSLLVKSILLMLHTPVLKKLVFNSFGIRMFLKLGVKNKKVITKEVLKSYQSPFSGVGGWRLLSRVWLELQNDELEEIIQKLPTLNVPVRIIYGEDDYFFPSLATEMERLKNDLPNATIRTIANCGHFLQEDQPEKLSQLLVEFLTTN